MQHWSNLLDFNFLRPSAFARHHNQEQQQQQRGHQRRPLAVSLPSGRTDAPTVIPGLSAVTIDPLALQQPIQQQSHHQPSLELLQQPSTRDGTALTASTTLEMENSSVEYAQAIPAITPTVTPTDMSPTPTPTGSITRALSYSRTSTASNPVLEQQRSTRLSHSMPNTGADGVLPISMPLTRSRQQQIEGQRRWLKKFMWVIGTMPFIAAIAVYNKIELMMWWWVMALPLIGVSLSLLLRWKLGQRLERLQQAEASRLSLALSLMQGPTHSASNQDVISPDVETPPPPPDYHASIITPPAYAVAQQPRKVPSYRSLENQSASARNGASRSSRGGGSRSGRGGFYLEQRLQLECQSTRNTQIATTSVDEPSEESIAGQRLGEQRPSVPQLGIAHQGSSSVAVSQQSPTSGVCLKPGTVDMQLMPEMVEVSSGLKEGVLRALPIEPRASAQETTSSEMYTPPSEGSSSSSSSRCGARAGHHLNICNICHECSKEMQKDLKGKTPCRE